MLKVLLKNYVPDLESGTFFYLAILSARFPSALGVRVMRMTQGLVSGAIENHTFIYNPQFISVRGLLSQLHA